MFLSTPVSGNNVQLYRALSLTTRNIFENMLHSVNERSVFNQEKTAEGPLSHMAPADVDDIDKY